MRGSGRGRRSLRARLSLATVVVAILAATWTPTTAMAEIRPAAIITDGTVTLGVNPEGDLNGAGVGLRYERTGLDAIGQGCLCEGWGVGDLQTDAFAGANRGHGGAINLVTESFTATSTTATSVVRGAGLRITHRYQPSPHPGVFRIKITVRNLTEETMNSVFYRRVMNWDFDLVGEYVSIDDRLARDVFSTSDNGFATVEPLSPVDPVDSRAGQWGGWNTQDSGPADHGALFDIGLGALLPGRSRSFRAFYGAAGTRAEALSALSAAGAEAYAISMPSTGPRPDGTPNTFLFGLAGVGGTRMPAVANRLRWAVLGDSYSSGTGLGKATNDCDRDDGAYGMRAFRTLNPTVTTVSAEDAILSKLTGFAFGACRGAATTGQFGLDDVTSSTDVVAMTIGGNDAFFGLKVRDCYTNCGRSLYGVEAGSERWPLTWDELRGRLAQVYIDTRRAMDPTGRLYVLSYLIPFSLEAQSCQGFNFEEQLAANAFATKLGDTIQQAVRIANESLEYEVAGIPGNVEFLDWRTGSRFSDLYTVALGYPNAGQSFDVFVSPNGLCAPRGSSEYLNGYAKNWLTSPNRGNAFHPNKAGYAYAGNLLAQAVASDFP